MNSGSASTSGERASFSVRNLLPRNRAMTVTFSLASKFLACSAAFLKQKMGIDVHSSTKVPSLSRETVSTDITSCTQTRSFLVRFRTGGAFTVPVK
jgi:hypothetical protein